MADPLDPDTISQRAFHRRVRGYDPSQVRGFLDEVAGTVRELIARYEAAHDRLLELGNRDMSAEFDRVSEDVARILQDAREAAEGMRKRAAADAESLVEEAQTTAVGLRSDAWMTAEKLLQDSGNEADAIVQAAERDALAIIGEAERDTHRRQTAIRRESEETIRAAKLEAERLLVDARTRSEELTQEAEREVEKAEDRAAAVEERRTEMLNELENARQTIGNLEAEIEKRREALAGPSPEEVESSTVKLLTGPDRENAAPAQPSGWAEGDEVVKIVRAPKRIVDPPAEPVDAEAMAAEVARLRSPIETIEPAADVEPDTVEIEEAAPPAREAAPVPSPTPDIDDLFARLRQVDEEATPPEVEAGAAETPPETAETVTEAEVPAAAEASGREDPFDLRDRSLLPVTNRALRGVKRELTEAQNIALEELRVESGIWEPDAAELAGRLQGPIAELLFDGYRAGAAIVGKDAAAEVPLDEERPGDAAGRAAQFSADLTSDVATALAESRREGQGPRQLAAVLSRVYRSWRTDEAERRVRDIASGAFHRGLIDGMGLGGVPASRWVVSGRGCATCREAAEAGAVPLGTAFEDAVTEPPAHRDCGCTLIPA